MSRRWDKKRLTMDQWVVEAKSGRLAAALAHGPAPAWNAELMVTEAGFHGNTTGRLPLASLARRCAGEGGAGKRFAVACAGLLSGAPVPLERSGVESGAIRSRVWSTEGFGLRHEWVAAVTEAGAELPGGEAWGEALDGAARHVCGVLLGRLNREDPRLARRMASTLPPAGLARLVEGDWPAAMVQRCVGYGWAETFSALCDSVPGFAGSALERMWSSDGPGPWLVAALGRVGSPGFEDSTEVIGELCLRGGRRGRELAAWAGSDPGWSESDLGPGFRALVEEVAVDSSLVPARRRSGSGL